MAGVYNLLTTLWFDIPIAVQPMHTICSIAVTEQLSHGQLMGAGLFVAGSYVKHNDKSAADYREVVWWGWDSVTVSAVIFVFLMATEHLPRVPSALVVFVWGCAVAIGTNERARGELSVGVTMNVTVPTAAEFGHGACHGAGGLAAQHRFGARSNVSMAFLGAVKLSLGLVFGRSLQALCTALPASVLGMLLSFSGLQLALCAKGAGVTTAEERAVMLATAGTEMALKSGVAFIVGRGQQARRWRATSQAPARTTAGAD
eukprot:gene40007-50376_t